MDAALQLLKAGRLALGIERDDLAVEHQRLPACPRPLPERRDDLGELAWSSRCPGATRGGPPPSGRSSAIARMPSYFGS
jgi:hypothetical protein